MELDQYEWDANLAGLRSLQESILAKWVPEDIAAIAVEHSGAMPSAEFIDRLCVKINFR